jgi:diamine N-acetyltransferase
LEPVAISYEPDNVGAKSLYASLGFYETGEMAGEELLAVLNLR